MNGKVKRFGFDPKQQSLLCVPRIAYIIYAKAGEEWRQTKNELNKNVYEN